MDKELLSPETLTLAQVFKSSCIKIKCVDENYKDITVVLDQCTITGNDKFNYISEKLHTISEDFGDIQYKYLGIGSSMLEDISKRVDTAFTYIIEHYMGETVDDLKDDMVYSQFGYVSYHKDIAGKCTRFRTEYKYNCNITYKDILSNLAGWHEDTDNNTAGICLVVYIKCPVNFNALVKKVLESK